MNPLLIAVSTQRSIGVVIFVLVLVGVAAYVIYNMISAAPEIGSEIEVAPNRKKYYEDEDLEGPRLDRYLTYALLLLIVAGLGLPLYWLAEPGRQEGAVENFGSIFVSRGGNEYEENCSACHGPNGVGGVATQILTEPDGTFIAEVNWTAPALNNVLLKYDRDEVQFVLDHGRTFSPMQPWSTVGGGAKTFQQIDNIIDYLESIQLSQDEARAQVAAGVEEMMSPSTDADGRPVPPKAASIGEALFNLETAAGSYSCARCHTRGWSYGDPQETGGGWFGPTLIDSGDAFANTEEYEAFIARGCEIGRPYGLGGLCDGGGQMPGFGVVYTPEQIAAVVEYEKSLDGTQRYDPNPAPLDDDVRAEGDDEDEQAAGDEEE